MDIDTDTDVDVGPISQLVPGKTKAIYLPGIPAVEGGHPGVVALVQCTSKDGEDFTYKVPCEDKALAVADDNIDDELLAHLRQWLASFAVEAPAIRRKCFDGDTGLRRVAFPTVGEATAFVMNVLLEGTLAAHAEFPDRAVPYLVVPVDVDVDDALTVEGVCESSVKYAWQLAAVPLALVRKHGLHAVLMVAEIKPTRASFAAALAVRSKMPQDIFCGRKASIVPGHTKAVFYPTRLTHAGATVPGAIWITTPDGAPSTYAIYAVDAAAPAPSPSPSPSCPEGTTDAELVQHLWRCVRMFDEEAETLRATCFDPVTGARTGFLSPQQTARFVMRIVLSGILGAHELDVGMKLDAVPFPVRVVVNEDVTPGTTAIDATKYVWDFQAVSVDLVRRYGVPAILEVANTMVAGMPPKSFWSSLKLLPERDPEPPVPAPTPTPTPALDTSVDVDAPVVGRCTSSE